MSNLLIDPVQAPTADGDNTVNPVKSHMRSIRWTWLLPLLPWGWFVIRGLHPVLELFAILLPPAIAAAAVIVLLTAAIFRRSDLVPLATSLVIFFAVAVFLPGRPVDGPEPADTFRVASINMAQQWFSDNDLGYFALTNAPDIFVGTELSASHDQALRKHYANGISDLIDSDPIPLPAGGLPDLGSTYRRNGDPSIGIYANMDIELLDDPIADEIQGGLPGFRVRVQTEFGDYIVYALHVPRPGIGGDETYEVSFSEQRKMLEAIERAASLEERPVVIVGDLNVVDRGASFAHLTTNLRDAMREQRWAGPTQNRSIWHSLLFLRIDHVLIDHELCVAETPQALDVMFTDHRPIIADIGPCPST